VIAESVNKHTHYQKSAPASLRACYNRGTRRYFSGNQATQRNQQLPWGNRGATSAEERSNKW